MTIKSAGMSSKLFAKCITLRAYSRSLPQRELYLNPHAWKGLPADRIFELHNLRKQHLQDKYVPNDDERNAILSTFQSLSKGSPALSYAYEIDNFTEKHMNNTPVNLRALPPKRSNVNVINKGSTPHERRKIEQLARVSAFEMPLLTKFRQEYRPKAVNKAPLKFSFNIDFDSDVAESGKSKAAVKVRFNIDDLDNMNNEERRNLKLLAGNKFDYNTNEVHIKSKKFPETAQNTRFLVDTVNKLLEEAKNLGDKFADVPLDSRHMPPSKPKIKFVEAWKRPEDAPVRKYKIMQTLVQKVRDMKDAEYIKKHSSR